MFFRKNLLLTLLVFICVSSAHSYDMDEGDCTKTTVTQGQTNSINVDCSITQKQESGESDSLALLERPRTNGVHIPDIAKGYEEIYLRFLNGKLIYRPYQNSDIGKVELPISALSDPLEGVFDLSKCGNSGQYLSVSTGYRKDKKITNKVEVWISPRFLIERDVNYSAAHFQPIMKEWNGRKVPVGVFWTWGGWDLEFYDYLSNCPIEDLGSENFYKKYEKASSTTRVRFAYLWDDLISTFYISF